jgi:hypothetical protein
MRRSARFVALAGALVATGCSFEGEVVPPGGTGGAGAAATTTTSAAGGAGGGASASTGGGTCDPDGGPPPQIVGDCKRVDCDSSGMLVTVVDDADVPASDANPCTTEACSGGVVEHTPKAVGSVVAAEDGVECPGVCQGGDYAGVCGYRLYSRKFPMTGAWSSVALSAAWTGPNAPPPILSPGISVAEETTAGSRLMVFRDDGEYYELASGAWQTPVAATTRFQGLVDGTKLGAGLTGRYGGSEDLFVLLTRTNPPQAYQYTIPEPSGAPVYDAGPTAVTDDSGMANGAPQATVPMAWAFGEQRATYGSTPDSVVSWKALQGVVYTEYAGSNGFYYPNQPVSEAASALAIDGTGGAPQPGTVVASYYHDATSTVFMIAP